MKAQVDLNLALGILLRNPMFEEAEPEFQHLASFATRIGLRNALQVSTSKDHRGVGSFQDPGTI